MQNSGKNNTILSLEIMEGKVTELLDTFKNIKEENKVLKTKIEEGNSSEVILDNFKRQQLRKKIQNLLDILEDF